MRVKATRELNVQLLLDCICNLELAIIVSYLRCCFERVDHIFFKAKAAVTATLVYNLPVFPIMSQRNTIRANGLLCR